AITGDLYGHTEDGTTRGAIEGLSDALGLAGFAVERSPNSAMGTPLGTNGKRHLPDDRKVPLTCVGLTGFEPATT
ncbi:MAG: hypothetical protein ABWY45_19225, partial [Mycobacterium sp.]